MTKLLIDLSGDLYSHIVAVIVRRAGAILKFKAEQFAVDEAVCFERRSLIGVLNIHIIVLSCDLWWFK